jgi:hypothetical protein
MQLGLLGAALAVTLPLTLANAVYVPAYACRRLGVSFGQYVRGVLLGPALCAVPFAAVLIGFRLTLADNPLLSLVCALAAGGPLLAVLYWRYALPQSLKRSVAARIGLKSHATGEPGNAPLPASPDVEDK